MKKKRTLKKSAAEAKFISPEVKASEPCAQSDAQELNKPQTQGSAADSVQATVTSTESTKKRLGSARGVSALHKVLVKKARGKKYKVRYNQLGCPIGETRSTLQSYIGMLARNMIPIDILSWPSVDAELKAKLWVDVQDTFKIAPESEGMVLQSAGTKWRQFKSNLTSKHVMPYVGQKKKLMKPPKQYAFVGKEVWRRFVAQRTDEQWLSLRSTQSARVGKRKYHHRLSRKGYIGLQEDEIKAGKLEPGELPDRAIFWKKARMPKDQMVDEELAKIHAKIDLLLEQKVKGEFQPMGSEDVLSTVLQTPEHGGRVRGVGGFITPKMYFNLPKEKRTRITKYELLARDRAREEEFKKTKDDFMSQIADLKAMISASNIASPMFSDKSSCQQLQGGNKVKPDIAKELLVDELVDELFADDECVAVDLPPPTGKKGPQLCELAVDCLENKVAFGMVYDDAEMNGSVHGVPLAHGCVRVSVDGIIQTDALVPVPIPGEIEKVHQAVGSHLAWPRDLIIFPNVAKKNKKVLQSKAENELQRLIALFNKVELNKNVPSRYKLLYKHAATFMKATGTSIPIPCDADVFGIEKTIYILHENLIALLEFDMIGQAAISTYMAYLRTVIRKNRKNNDEVYGFLDPAATFTLNNDFESYVVNRLREGNSGHIYFLPHNHNCHWILIVICDGEIYLLNPLSHPTRFPALEKALAQALKSYNAQTGRGNKVPKIKNLAGSPKQPGGVECGYVVMRYMRDIIYDKELSFATKWAAKTRKSYTMEELDEVRLKTLKFIQDKV